MPPSLSPVSNYTFVLSFHLHVRLYVFSRILRSVTLVQFFLLKLPLNWRVFPFLLTAVSMKMMITWVVALCSLVQAVHTAP